MTYRIRHLRVMNHDGLLVVVPCECTPIFDQLVAERGDPRKAAA